MDVCAERHQCATEAMRDREKGGVLGGERVCARRRAKRHDCNTVQQEPRD